MPHQTRENSQRQSSPRPDSNDAVCPGCGEKVISKGGRCPNGCATKTISTSSDEIVKKVVDDNDLMKGGF